MSQKEDLINKLKQHGITEPAILKALKKIPREDFVLSSYQKHAYDDTALPIESKQTISQPYIVALMSQALLQAVNQPQKILEIGTGSGYQTAILAELFPHVFTIERIPELYQKAKKTLSKLGYSNIDYQLGDGALGWEEQAPFDGIIVTACAESLPSNLIDQLSKNNGAMIIPLGKIHHVQQLTLIKKNEDTITSKPLEYVSFVPLITTH